MSGSKQASPPFFGNLGKNFKDLLTKKYDFYNSVKVTNKTAFGLTLATTGKIEKESISGSSKATYVEKSFGEAEIEIDTGAEKAWAKASLDQLLKGGKIILGGGFEPKHKDPLIKNGLSVKGDFEYKHDIFSFSDSVVVGTDSKGVSGANVEVNAVLGAGVEGLSVGGQVKFALDQAAQTVSDYNLGVQYEKDNFVASLLTEKQAQVIKFSWFHKVCKDYQLGAEIISDENGKLTEKGAEPRPVVLSLASQFQLDVDTLVKAKANNFGELAAVVEHRLSNPALVVGAAAQFKAKGFSKFATEKFGLSLAFGDA